MLKPIRVQVNWSQTYWICVDNYTLSLCLEMAKIHYDSRCRSQGTLVTWLFGALNWSDYEYPCDTSHSISMNDIDVMLKISENVGFMPFTFLQMVEIHKFRHLLLQLFKCTNYMHDELLQETYVLPYQLKHHSFEYISDKGSVVTTPPVMI